VIIPKRCLWDQSNAGQSKTHGSLFIEVSPFSIFSAAYCLVAGLPTRYCGNNETSLLVNRGVIILEKLEHHVPDNRSPVSMSLLIFFLVASLENVIVILHS